jgi:integrase
MAGLTPVNSRDSVFGTKAGSNNGKSPSEEDAGSSPLHPHLQVNPTCPECSSADTLRDGHRYLKNGEDIQRWICKRCGYRFSEPLQENSKQSLKTWGNILISPNMRSKEAKNLTTATELKTVAGRQPKCKPLPQEAQGCLTKYMAYLDNEAYGKESRYVGMLYRLLVLGADLYNPENVKSVIARQIWKGSTKMLSCYAYDAFCKMEKISWSMPHFKQGESLFYVPDEKDLDALIAAAKSKRMAAFLRCLKETFADPGEVLGLNWKDLSGNVITINKPVNGHLPGQIKISLELTGMLNNLPKKSTRIFPTSYNSIAHCFRILRKATARRLQNPKILHVTFKSFRHWEGSMLAYITSGNVLAVKKALRHKQVTNTMKYIHRLEFQDPESFDVVTATTVEDIQRYAKEDYMKFDEFNGIHVYRRTKKYHS